MVRFTATTASGSRLMPRHGPRHLKLVVGEHFLGKGFVNEAPDVSFGCVRLLSRQGGLGYLGGLAGSPSVMQQLFPHLPPMGAGPGAPFGDAEMPGASPVTVPVTSSTGGPRKPAAKRKQTKSGDAPAPRWDSFVYLCVSVLCWVRTLRNTVGPPGNSILDSVGPACHISAVS